MAVEANTSLNSVIKILFTALSILTEQREKSDSVKWTCGFWTLLGMVSSQNLN